MLIQEIWINKTKGCCSGETEKYEPFTNDVGELYRSLVKTYGRCIGKVYVDGKDGEVLHVGWVFLKRKKYDDYNETFLLETWVTLYDEPDTVTEH